MRPGTTIDGAAFVGDGVEEGPKAGDEVDVVDGSGVASEMAVPKTPANVASPSAAASEAEDTLEQSTLLCRCHELGQVLTLVDMNLD